MPKEGNRNMSKYGTNILSPMVLKEITRIGVKQHIATKIVPVAKRQNFLFELLIDR